MSSSEKGQPQSLLEPPAQQTQSHKRRRTSIFLGVLSVVALVAALGVCGALLYAKHADTNSAAEINAEESNHLQQRSMEIPQDYTDTGSHRPRARRGIPRPAGTTSRPSPTSSDGSCESRRTESSIPAAHVKGHGIQRGKWIQSTRDSGSVLPGYQQRWTCNDIYNENHPGREQAFVDGGVWFNQTDKSIYVPSCGYYHVYSQILFMMSESTLTESVTVYHNLKIKPNCSATRDTGPIQLQAKASIAPYTMENHDGGIATTYTSDVVFMCEGGQMWIEIPDGENGVPCCPRGEESGTFMGLALIASVPCSSWPPTITMTAY